MECIVDRSDRVGAQSRCALEFRSRKRAQQVCAPTRRLATLIIAACLTFASPLLAHDAFEIWTIAVLRPDHLEVGITMAQSTALRLIDPQMKARAISHANFEAQRALLEREAPKLCILTHARKPLVVRKVEIELTDENDVVFKLVYPRPTAGPMHIHAAMLKKLGNGYGGIFDASEPNGRHLGWDQLSSENPNIEITIPPRETPPS